MKFSAYVHIVLLIGLLMIMGLESDCGATCEQEEEGTTMYYEFFRKGMRNPTTIPTLSAYSWRQRLVTFRQEAQKDMWNTNTHLPWSCMADPTAVTE